MIVAIALALVLGVAVHVGARLGGRAVLGKGGLGARLVASMMGPAANYALAVLLVALGYTMGGRPYVDTVSLEVVVVPGGPAATAGMKDGDRVMLVNDEQPEDFLALQRIVEEHRAEPLKLHLERADGETDIVVTPGAPGTPFDGKIGVTPPMKNEPVDVLHAVKYGVFEPVKTLARAGLALARSVLRDRTPPDFYGPVGMVRAAPAMGAPELLKAIGGFTGLLLPLFFIVGLVPVKKRGAA